MIAPCRRLSACLSVLSSAAASLTSLAAGTATAGHAGITASPADLLQLLLSCMPSAPACPFEHAPSFLLRDFGLEPGAFMLATD